EDAGQHRPVPSITSLIENLLLQQFAPVCVMVNERGEIVYIHGRTGQYLEPAPGRPNLILVNMAREGLQHDLMAALHRVMTSKEKEVRRKDIQVKTNGDMVLVDLTVKRVQEPESLRGLYQVTFESRPPAPSPPPHQKKKAEK